MSDSSLTEALLRRERAISLVALIAVAAAGWLYLLSGAGMGMPAWQMTSWEMALGLKAETMASDAMSGSAMSSETMMGGTMVGGTMAGMAMPAPWSPGYAAVMAGMWWVMMIAMMLPSAAPMILLYARVSRRKLGQQSPWVGLLHFLSGYLLAWAGFSLAATALQWGFEALGWLSPGMMNSESRLFSGLLLCAAGLYQFSNLKQACLRHCRGPIDFLARHWRAGPRGALVMGLHHGLFCLGCCWGLMLLLFFGGVMNLFWIGGLALLVLLEKVGPAARIWSRLTGALLTLWGCSLLWFALAA